MDSAQKFVHDQVNSLEKVVKGLRDLDREAALKKVEVDPISRSLEKLKKRAAELEEARRVALSDIERQIKMVVGQIDALELQAKAEKEAKKQPRKAAKEKAKRKVTKKTSKAVRKKSKTRRKPSG